MYFDDFDSSLNAEDLYFENPNPMDDLTDEERDELYDNEPANIDDDRNFDHYGGCAEQDEPIDYEYDYGDF